MAIEHKNEYGTVALSEELLASVIGLVVGENYGIVGMNAKKPSETFIELIKRDSVRRGVRVSTVSDNLVDVDLYITAEYGVSLPAVAENVRDSVRYRVAELAGVDIRDINIHVQGIRAEIN